MAITLRTVDRDTWQQLAPHFTDYNYRQLWEFGLACAKRLNATSEHVAIYDGEELLGLADVRIKAIPFTGTGVAYINGGPLVCNGQNGHNRCAQLEGVLKGLQEVYVKRRRLVLRVRPALGSACWNDLQSKTFLKMGCFYRTRQKPYRTFVLPLALQIGEIRKQLKQKWRNCLNNVEKRDLDVKFGTDESYFDDFHSLYRELTHRKEFDVDLNPEFYHQVQKSLPERERLLVCVVYENGEPVAGHVSSILGDTCVYLLGATSDAGLRNKAAYLAQWSVIQLAKARRCQFYDLGGIDPDSNPGVYHFKKGLGGVDVTAAGPFEIYPDRMREYTVRYAEKAYQLLKSTRKTQ